MVITFSNETFHQQKIVFHNKVAVLMGLHGQGKTAILQTLAEGFSGKNKQFYVNQQPVTSEQFQVLFLEDQFDLKKTFKISRSSPFRGFLIQKLNQYLLSQERPQDYFAIINEEISKITPIIETFLNEKQTNLDEYRVRWKIASEPMEIGYLVDHLLTINLYNRETNTPINFETCNRFLGRMMMFYLLENFHYQEDPQRITVILVDNPELYCNFQTGHQFNRLLHRWLKQKNCYVIFTSNNFDYLLDFEMNFLQLHWVNKETGIFRLPNPDEVLLHGIKMTNFNCNNEYQDWFWYQNDFQNIFTKEDLVSEWTKFNFNFLRDFLKGLFAKTLLIDETKTGTERFKFCDDIEKPNTLQVTLNLDKLIVLSCFWKNFGKKIVLNSKILENYPKLKLLDD